jgi:hypothetical protein
VLRRPLHVRGQLETGPILDGIEDAATMRSISAARTSRLSVKYWYRVPRAIRAGAQMSAMDVSWKPLRADTASAQSGSLSVTQGYLYHLGLA